MGKISSVFRTSDKYSSDKNIREICRLNNISEQTFYRWRTKFGGMDVSEAKRLKDLERENSELKKIVADLTLDNRMLKDLNSKKW
ncbi:MAG: transposase [Deltaproteobacteria bacterium]|nr:transposase [Deltaproteobacteria bacterium]